MGMFDSVNFACPKCRSIVEVQSKAGGCNLRTYSSQNVPAVIAADLSGDTVQCPSCNETWQVHSSVPKHVVLFLGPVINDPDEG